ncbi:glycosyltransferase family 4 protein [Sphingobacterium multivorum]|uniref:glycosyltransferase family 4 protein n=1 Tax=Sphingobacterium multivorum TaxID=28454 RepID=UPI0028971804|nr:glycosyltransferase family 1 protein [Sphingobacterium multivorum]
MRIIFDNIIYSLQRSGGGSVYWTELIKRFYSSDIETIFYDSIKSDNIFRNSLDLGETKKEIKYGLAIRRYLPFYSKESEKHIFHSSYYRYSNNFNAINITTIHDFTTEKFRHGLAREVNLWQKRLAVKKSSGVICISENTKRDLLHYVPDIDERKVKVIYNGVSDDFYHINSEFSISDKDSKFADLENFRYLLYIGHRTAYKNFYIAVRTAANFISEYKFVIIGESFTDEEKGMVEEILGNNYVVLSNLNNEKLNFLYNKAFALLYPSSYEGFGIPIVEAMKTGCCVVAANNSSIPEVAGDAALLIDSINEEKMVNAVKLLKNTVLREDLKEKGFKQSKKFNWDLTFIEYCKFYLELYNER